MTAKQALEEQNETPWSWLKSMSRDLYNLDATPLLGYPPEFPWESFANSFATTLGLSECTAAPSEFIWREKQDLLKGIPGPHYWIEIASPGIDSSLFVVMSKQDILLLMHHVLAIPLEAASKEPEDMKDAFQHFIAIQTVHIINSLDFDKRLSFKIVSFDKSLEEPALCQDAYITVANEKMLVRLCMPSSFQKSWSNFFPGPQKTLPPTKYRLEQALVPVHIEAGQTTLSLNQLLKLQSGDFLFIDRPIYIPDSEKNHVIATLQNRPLFRAELKDGSLNILEIPLLHEVYDSMVDKVNQPFAPSGYNPDERPPQLPPIEDDEENPFEDEDDEDEGELSLEQELPAPPKATAPITPQPKPQTNSGPLKELTANDIPLTLTIEVAQLNVTAQKLLELQPGNVLDLEISPEAGVDLVIAGRIIGKGELLKIGDSIGVRIQQIGT